MPKGRRRSPPSGAEKIAAIRAEEACLKAEDQKAAVKAVKEAEELAEEARKAEEENAEKLVVIRAEEARPKAKPDERTTAEKAGAVTREAHNSAAEAKEAAAANEVTKRQAAKDIGDGAPGGQDQRGSSPLCPGS